MDDIEDIKCRVRKLLALSKSPNENEATLAMKKANDLIGMYELSRSELEGYVRKTVKGAKRYLPWKTMLANAVEQLYATYHCSTDKGEFAFYGEELDVFMSTEMYVYLVKTVDRMARQNVPKNAKYRYRQSYRTGIASRLWDRMNELGQKCSWRNPAELASKKNEISDWVHKEMSVTEIKNTTVCINRNAFDKGTIDADGINLSRQMPENVTARIVG